MKVGDQTLDLSSPQVMTIVNVTSDSFFAGSRTTSESEIAERVTEAISQGASIIDVGGYSSRPGADDVEPEEETRRVLLGVKAVRSTSEDIVISIDTFRSAVADAVISRYGACIINDITAAEADPAMADTAARYGVPFIAMHSKGTPKTMQTLTQYDDIVEDVRSFFGTKLMQLRAKGVKDIIIDPGFGFAKTTEQNYRLLANMDRLKEFGCPVLAGISRKSMIYKVLGTAPQNALNGTTALHWECLLKGADILRVHDTRAAAETIRIFNYYKKHSGI